MSANEPTDAKERKKKKNTIGQSKVQILSSHRTVIYTSTKNN